MYDVKELLQGFDIVYTYRIKKKKTDVRATKTKLYE